MEPPALLPWRTTRQERCVHIGSSKMT